MKYVSCNLDLRKNAGVKSGKIETFLMVELLVTPMVAKNSLVSGDGTYVDCSVLLK
jgi:hypothetical protein